MQIFLIGKTKTGKTTLANQIKKILQSEDLKIYEAGQWAREEFAQINSQKFNEFDLLFKEELTKYAISKLKQDPSYSIKQFQKWLKINSSEINKSDNLTNLINSRNHLIIAGVRNPDDLIEMLKQDSRNKIIFIGSDKKMGATVEDFEEGIEVIKAYIEWKAKIDKNISSLYINEKEIGNQDLLIKLKEWL